MRTGHIIPPPVIEHFLEGVTADGGPSSYEGFPHSGFFWQELTNPCLRRYWKVDDSVKGVLATDVRHGNTCHGALEKHDIVCAVDGRPVANNGTVAFGGYGRVDVSIVFTMFQCGDAVDIDLIRNGERRKVRVTAKPYSRLVPLPTHDLQPRYYVFCGLVFQPVSYDYLDSIDWSSTALTKLYYSGRQSEDLREVVILSQTLSDEINVGYAALANRPIKSVNGESVRDLADLAAKIEASSEALLRIDLVGDEGIIVVPPPKDSEASEANARILSRYKVPTDRCLE